MKKILIYSLLFFVTVAFHSKTISFLLKSNDKVVACVFDDDSEEGPDTEKSNEKDSKKDLSEEDLLFTNFGHMILTSGQSFIRQSNPLSITPGYGMAVYSPPETAI